METTELPRFLTISEVAHCLSLHPKTIKHLIRDGYLRAIRIGARGDIRVSSAELDDFIRRSRA